QAGAAVDVKSGKRRLERQLEGTSSDRRGPVEELDRREALLDDGRGIEGLAALEANVDRVGPDVSGQKAAGQDLARRVQRKVALEVLEILLVRIVADRKHAPEAPRQVIGNVVEAHLPS